MKSMRVVGGALALLACMLHAETSSAQEESVEAFFKGRQLTLIVGTEAGGAYDVVGRAVVRHMPQYIPGNPRFVVQNMPGAGGVVTANYIYNVAARDGSVIGLSNNSFPTAPLLNPGAPQFDPGKFAWIGSSNIEHLVIAAWHTSCVSRLEDLFKCQFTVGGTGPGSSNIDYPVAANSLLGTRFRVVAGYSGIPSVVLAMQRGELDGSGSIGWTDARTTNAELIQSGKLRIIAQHGARKHPDLPDVPLFPIGDNADNRAIFDILYARNEFGRPFFGPPGVPAARMEALRKAFAATLKDAEFLAEASKLNIPIELTSGEQLEALARKVAEAPPELAKRTRDILATGAR